MKKTKKIISLLLSILMIITALPLTAVNSFAADKITSGVTGDCIWSLDGTVLTISGNGKMGDFYTPWGKLITEVIIKNGVTSIGYEAFDGCTSLTNITIPDSITSIGRSAFRSCTSLTNITIPDSVTSIGSSAFSGCTSLASITIPDGVTSIGRYAFSGTAYYNNSSNWENGLLYIGKHLISAKEDISGSVTIKQETKTIAINAFGACSSLTSVTISDSVTSIGSSAFEGCTSLTNITIPDSVTSIGSSAFSGCTSLTSATIGNGVTSIDSSVFRGCASLTNITIPESVTSIGGSALRGCTSLTNITIPDSVTSLGSSAFWDCTSLKSIIIPNSVIGIGRQAFYGCRSLTSVTIGNGVTSIGEETFRGCSSIESITIPNSVISIGRQAFYGCPSLTNITIPDSVTSIGGGAFQDCTSLESIIIPDSVTSIGAETFRGCTSLTSATIGNGVTSIGNSAFSGCTSLTSITIPDSVTSIGGGAFQDCTSLESIIIPDSVTSIGAETFRGCTSLTSATIGNGVTSIGYSAFYICSSLTNITIPNSVTSISDCAFYYCTSLESVTIGNGVTSISRSAFEYCHSLTNITIPDGVTEIGSAAFEGTAYYNNKSNWENGLLYIGNHLISAKEDISGSVTIKQETKTIAGSAFRDRASLTSVTIPDSLTSIGGSAFMFCTSLTSITIPDSVTNIGDYAFSGCTSLTSITIPKSVKDIGSEAFGYYYDSIENKYKAVDGFTIYGYQGSAAERYANENGFEFLPMASTYELLLISVTKMPTKTEYFIGGTLDTTGLEITAKYTDNTTMVIKDGFVISGFASSVAGKNTITVAYDSKTTTFDVEIKAPEISLSESSLSFDHVDKTATLTATAVPSDSEIVWKSSNESVATVENGVVTAKGAGNATITATITVNGIEYSAECTVDVKLPTMTFPDVRSGDWYSDAVKYNFERGYITGYSNGTFGPANNIQRQDFALILARIAGADLSAYEGKNGGFSDVPTNTYYSAAVAWAKDRGIVTGYSADNFGVGTYITREQISLILCRYLGGEASGDVDAILNAYPDGGNTSAWAKVGVAWAVENGIVGNAGYINPTGNAGRAEVAQIIYNMSNKGMI